MMNINVNSPASRVLRLAGVLAVLAGALVLADRVALAVHDIGVFELDGDAVNDPAVLGDDWDTVNLGGGGGSIAHTGVVADPAPGSIFTGGGSKDPIDISSWKHKDGSTPDKDDITNAYAAAYSVNGQLLIYFGADRFANDGDAQLGFWFFQQNVTRNPNGSFNGVHQVGDTLVLANFSQGGSVSTIQVLEWVGTGGNQQGGTLNLVLTATGAQCGPNLTGDVVCATTNEVPTGSPWPYTPKSGPSGTFPPVSFFEGGINITQVFAGTTPPCFASFLAETRSSTSVNATLKDFVLGSFPVCGISISKTCPSSRLNDDETAFVYDYNGTVTNTGFGTLYDVTVVDDVGTPGDTSDDVTFNLGTLNAGASATFSGSFQSSQNPATNTARVSAATTPGGPVSVSATSNPAQCPPVLVSPHISVTKVCQVRLTVINGQVVVAVDFAGQVCSGDQVGLDNVTVTDDSGTPGNPADDEVFSLGSLAKSQCKPYSGTYLPSTTFTNDPGSASFSDTVKAQGDARLGFGHVEATQTATCPLCP
jgi:hypothetical protein